MSRKQIVEDILIRYLAALIGTVGIILPVVRILRLVDSLFSFAMIFVCMSFILINFRKELAET